MTAKKPTKAISKAIQNAAASAGAQDKFANGLAEAVGFNNGFGGQQVNSIDTIICNLRGYLLSNLRQILSEGYIEHGIIQRVVNIPVEDALRGGIDIISKQLSPQQVDELQDWLESNFDEQSEATEQSEDILNGVIGLGEKWNRLYGGGGILSITDQDPATPLQIERITDNSNLDFRACDLWELFYDVQNINGFNPSLDPLIQMYSYYGMRVHASRVTKLKGLEAPSWMRPRLRGWGFSVIETLVNSLNPYLKTKNLIFEVLDEFKVDYYGIENLTETLLSSDGTTAMQKRIAIANWQKNYQHAVVMDSKDKFEQKQLTFAGLAEIPKENRMQIAADCNMPMSKLFGIASSGFSSGEDDIENYCGMIESTVRPKLKKSALRMLRLKCQQRFGFVPDDLKVRFKTLRILSAEQEENVKTQQFNRLAKAREMGEMDSKEFKQACNKGNLLIIQVDENRDTLQPTGAEGADDNLAPGAENKKREAKGEDKET